MKYAYQVMIIGGISFAGEILNKLLPLPVPASVYGMVLLLVCLCTKVIKLDQIQETADFMLGSDAAGVCRTWSGFDGVIWIDERFFTGNSGDFRIQYHAGYGIDRYACTDSGKKKKRPGG